MFDEALTYRKIEKREDVCVLLDIGNGSVGGSLVFFSENNKPQIIYSVRYPLHIPEKPSSGHLLLKMTKLLEDVVASITNEGSRHLDFRHLSSKDIKHVFCIFSSPWYSSKTKIFKIERGEALPMTDEFVSYLLERESDTFEKSIGGNGNGMLSFIEKKVIRTRLNGYDTKMPYNQAARNVELGVFMSMVPQAVLDKVGKIIRRHFNARHIEYNSFALMSFSIIEDLFPSVQNYIFIDITSEVTEISIVRNNLITETLSLPLGKNLIMRAIAKRYHVSPDIADSYLKLFIKNHAEKSLKGAVSQAIKDAEAKWLPQFGQALQTASKNHAIPGRIFMTADEDVAAAFNHFISEASRNVNGKPEKFNLTVLSKEILAHFCTFGRGSQEDSFLAIESLYFNKIFNL